ncbi:MAG: hypothetical protein HKN43_08225, partial [Rhodothermales bacterium]|nr:hypothetical protein [Rhodothermales bacterium]
LNLVGQSFSNSQLQLDRLGTVLGELHFGEATQSVLGGVEGLMFGCGVIGAMSIMKAYTNRKNGIWRL